MPQTTKTDLQIATNTMSDVYTNATPSIELLDESNIDNSETIIVNAFIKMLTAKSDNLQLMSTETANQIITAAKQIATSFIENTVNATLQDVDSVAADLTAAEIKQNIKNALMSYVRSENAAHDINVQTVDLTIDQYNTAALKILHDAVNTIVDTSELEFKITTDKLTALLHDRYVKQMSAHIGKLTDTVRLLHAKLQTVTDKLSEQRTAVTALVNVMRATVISSKLSQQQQIAKLTADANALISHIEKTFKDTQHALAASQQQTVEQQQKKTDKPQDAATRKPTSFTDQFATLQFTQNVHVPVTRIPQKQIAAVINTNYRFLRRLTRRIAAAHKQASATTNLIKSKLIDANKKQLTTFTYGIADSEITALTKSAAVSKLNSGLLKFGGWFLALAALFAGLVLISNNIHIAIGRWLMTLRPLAGLAHLINSAVKNSKLKMLTALKFGAVDAYHYIRGGSAAVRAARTVRHAKLVQKARIIKRLSVRTLTKGGYTTKVARQLGVRGTGSALHKTLSATGKALGILGVGIEMYGQYMEDPSIWAAKSMGISVEEYTRRKAAGDLAGADVAARSISALTGGSRGIINAIFNGLKWATVGSIFFPVIGTVIMGIIGVVINLIGQETFLKIFIGIQRLVSASVKLLTKLFTKTRNMSATYANKLTTWLTKKMTLRRVRSAVSNITSVLTHIQSVPNALRTILNFLTGHMLMVEKRVNTILVLFKTPKAKEFRASITAKYEDALILPLDVAAIRLTERVEKMHRTAIGIILRDKYNYSKFDSAANKKQSPAIHLDTAIDQLQNISNNMGRLSNFINTQKDKPADAASATTTTTLPFNDIDNVYSGRYEPATEFMLTNA